MVTYIEFGNIFKIEGVQNYAHGCNCAGAMGKGIAVAFKERYPKMYQEYKMLCRTGKFTLGSVYEYNYGDGYVFNLGTQVSWTTRANIEAVGQAIEKMLSIASTLKIDKIALPKIGAGLGGLNWDDVKAVIDTAAADFPEVDLFVVENFRDE
ncbi:macro domain-containing protein [Chitinophaga sp. CF418]|uniref:macro domain-containing protein n=1 Tax=Chitinophaga sp. CF418 TaxID=1855287 RepID=UPI000910E89A|nr:macro domain-containing protein [Chitinophaga sp. CF418]SHN40951.1 O-acetyl-ADP-ribose deacetylase (regulator of RNase III), contains Macro domain [Chitinophaga sp. CF418]